MLWIKAFHIIFVISLFSGLFYLPRILVNLAMVPQESIAERQRLLNMGRKLSRFMHILGFFAVSFGVVLWLYYGIGSGQTWLYAKLIVVFLIFFYHHTCTVFLGQFEKGTNTRSHVWYRVFNEISIFLLVAAVILVVVKPF